MRQKRERPSSWVAPSFEVIPMASRRNLQQVLINNASSGNLTVFTNPSSTAFAYVWAISVSVAGTANLTFKDSFGNLTGAMSFTATEGYSGVDNGVAPWFAIGPSQSFIINDSAGVQKSGFCNWSN